MRTTTMKKVTPTEYMVITEDNQTTLITLAEINSIAELDHLVYVKLRKEKLQKIMENE